MSNNISKLEYDVIYRYNIYIYIYIYIILVWFMYVIRYIRLRISNHILNPTKIIIIFYFHYTFPQHFLYLRRRFGPVKRNSPGAGQNSESVSGSKYR